LKQIEKDSQRKLTAIMLKRPINAHKIPPEMTTRHKGSPRFVTLVATLLRLPRVLNPKIIIVRPRNTSPDSSLSSGQLLAKYDLKSVSSDAIRKIPMTLVTKWEVPSKKKTVRSQCLSYNMESGSSFINNDLQFDV
jgi:hypothetical protein